MLNQKNVGVNRKKHMCCVLMLLSIFSFQLGASCVKLMSGQDASYVLTDVEDNGQQSEDSKSEVKLKEYNLNKANALERKMNLAYSIEYAQLNVFVSSRIFIDIITPPPQV